MATCTAAALTAAGARPGDRLVVQVEKSAANVLLYLASLRAGLIYVPLNTAYTVEELAYFIGDADPSVVVCDPSRAYAARALTSAAVLTLDAEGEGIYPPPAAFETVARGPDDLAAILYTSGTTGRSKGAMLSDANLRPMRWR